MPSPFDPAPAMPGWMFDFESGGSWPAGDDAWFRAIFDYRLYNVFAAAAAERIVAAGGSATDFPALATGNYSIDNWAALQEQIYTSLVPSCLQAYDGGGAQLDYATPFDPATLVLTDPATYLRRKYPREITTLAAAGTSGWYARLVGGAAGSGGVYTYSGGAWVPAVAGSKPDVLSDVGLRQSGDYWGPWFLNDLRDLLNQLVVFPYISGVTPIFGTAYTANAEDNQNSGTDAIDYGSGANLTSADGTPIARQTGGTLYLRRYAYGVATDVPANGGMLRRLYYLTLPQSELGVYDAQGDGFVEGLLNLIGTSGDISAATYTTPAAGNVSLPIPINDGGYSLSNETVYGRWDVTGGFAYTKYT